MKKFNKDLSGFPIGFENGGLPVFNDDLLQLETNTTLSGVYSLLRGYSVVLSGCLITNVNTTTKKCDMTEGLVLIDDIIYKVSALTNQTYPFSIQHSSEVDDNRGFKSGDTHTVATTYTYSIRTNFIFGWNQDLYPNNLTTSEIYFDPFTCQRAEYVLKNLANNKGDISLLNNFILQVNKDELGGNLTGSFLDISTSHNLKWKYYGYSKITSAGKLAFGGNTIGQTGSDSLTLNSNNIPAHKHDLLPGNVTTNTDGQHKHEFRNAFFAENTLLTGSNPIAFPYLTNQKGEALTNLKGATSTDTDNNALAFTDDTLSNGSHYHGVIGYTENNVTNNTPIDISGQKYNVEGIVWNGYPTQFTVTEALSPTGVKQIAYAFWKNNTIKYTNM